MTFTEARMVRKLGYLGEDFLAHHRDNKGQSVSPLQSSKVVMSRYPHLSQSWS